MTARAITCGICGKASAREVSTRRAVHLLGHEATYPYREFKCKSCGESFTNDEQGEHNERAERRATTRTLREVGGAELKFVRDLMSVTQPQLENALGLGRNTVARWETGQRPVPPYIKTIIRLLALNPSALYFLHDQDLPDEERVGRVAEGTIRPQIQYSDVRALGPMSDELQPFTMDVDALMHLPPVGGTGWRVTPKVTAEQVEWRH